MTKYKEKKITVTEEKDWSKDFGISILIDIENMLGKVLEKRPF